VLDFLFGVATNFVFIAAGMFVIALVRALIWQSREQLQVAIARLRAPQQERSQAR